jgi:hypothetical protein
MLGSHVVVHVPGRTFTHGKRQNNLVNIGLSDTAESVPRGDVESSVDVMARGLGKTIIFSAITGLAIKLLFFRS